jgi:hypothetical protein
MATTAQMSVPDLGLDVQQGHRQSLKRLRATMSGLRRLAALVRADSQTSEHLGRPGVNTGFTLSSWQRSLRP